MREVAQMREGMVTATRDLSELEDLRVLIEQTQAVEDIFRKAAADVEVWGWGTRRGYIDVGVGH